MLGFFCFLIIAAVVCVGGCTLLQRHTEREREAVYAEIWKTAPELERAHKNLSSELMRLNDLKEEINKRKQLFTTDEGRQSADAKIEAVNQQIARLHDQAEAIIAAVEQQSMTNLASKVENSMQKEKIQSLETKAKEAAKDASNLREDIERGVAGDIMNTQRQKSMTNAASKVEISMQKEKIRSLETKSKEAARDASNLREESERGLTGNLMKERSIPKAIIVKEDRPAMRTWEDSTGYRASARLLGVLDSREREVNVIGVDPRRLLKSGYRVRLQKIDGEIVTIRIERLSARDISLLSKGG